MAPGGGSTTSKSHSLLCATAHSTQVRSEPSTRAAVQDLQQQGEPGLRSPVAALLVLRLQLRLGGGKRSAVPRLRVSTVIGALPTTVLHRVVIAASVPCWNVVVLRARRVLSLDANSDVVHVTYKSVALWPLPFRAAPRDVCLLRYWQRNARDGSLTMRFYDTVSPACAPVEGFVRARCVAGEVKIVATTQELAV